MVRPGRESFKRFVKTILEQLPTHVEQYPPPDHLLLMEFLSVLQHYEEADNQRNKLSQRFEEYNSKLLGTDQYLQTPFLWFTYNYFWNANLLLNISKFHADLFYEYLAKHLRGSSTTPGVYKLVREKIPLSDLTWEQLQYESNKLLIPLTENQLQILNSIYSSIAEIGVYSLDSRELRSEIVKQTRFPKNSKPSTELNRFFTRMDARWFLHFFSPAFGLEHMFIQLQLHESTSLENIIDFNDAANTVLTFSDVYRARNLFNTFIMYLLVPTHEINQLEKLFLYYKDEKLITIEELTYLTNTSISSSLNQYRTNSGWFELSASKMSKLTTFLKAKQPRTRQMENSVFMTPTFNCGWTFRQHPLPTEIIKLYCKIPHEFVYPNLPLRAGNEDTVSLSRAEIGLLKQLYYNEAVRIGFVPWRLVYALSLDLYCIILPKIPSFQLQRFLDLIPYSEIYFSENSTYIRARLTPKLVNWIKNDLKWKVISLIREHDRDDLNFDQFNSKELQWKTPKVLSAE